MYQITPYTKDQARRYGVVVRPSGRAGKKIDVFRDGRYLASVGALGYDDYPTYMRTKGREYAEERRRLYWARHGTNPAMDTPAFWALHLLW